MRDIRIVGGFFLQLSNYKTTISDLFQNSGAQTILLREFPELSHPVVLEAFSGMTLANMIEIENGHLTQDKLNDIFTELASV
jgi:hypothetical protein